MMTPQSGRNRYLVRPLSMFRSVSRHRADAGFTLIEALVTLVIASVLSLLMLQSVRSAVSNGVRIERTAQAAAGAFIAQGALRRSIENTRAYYRDTLYSFSGDEEGFSGLTVAPIDGELGDFQRYAVRLQPVDAGLELIYEDPDSTLTVARWREAQGQIDYYGADTTSAFDSQAFARLGEPASELTWRQVWPGDARAPSGYSDPLPAAVRITVRSRDEPASVMIFHMPANAPPPPRLEDIIGGMGP